MLVEDDNLMHACVCCIVNQRVVDSCAAPPHTHHDVGVPVEELDKLLQTPEAALEAAEEEPGALVVCSWER